MIDQEDFRPDPDELLKKINESESENTRGRLKIYFGMCAGVGKTYALLEDAHKAKSNGIDTAIGFVETHKRRETEKMTVGLETIPRKSIQYRGAIFEEFDIDATLERKPKLVIVDEAAHTNIPGCRHPKRYQDILELLDNGIDVLTAVNVQHLESRAETVKQITGSEIRETVPDSFIDRADEIEVVDITPDELLQRLSEGKVYTPEQSKRAIKNFFKKGNLTALREMVLRLTAERVDHQLRDYKAKEGIDRVWKSGQRLMVAIGPGPHSLELIRWTRRLSSTMEASWIAVYIESDKPLKDDEREGLARNLELAKDLGAEIITSTGLNVVNALLRIARLNNVTQIVVGKSRLQNFLTPKTIVDKLVEQSGEIDVYIVGGDEFTPKGLFPKIDFKFSTSLLQYFYAILSVVTTAVLSFQIKEDIGYQTISFIFLFLITLMPLVNFGRGPIIVASILSALIWDFFFIPPIFTIHISNTHDVLMIILFFVIAIVSGGLTAKVKAQERFVRSREERTNALFQISKGLSEAKNLDDVADIAVQSLKQFFRINATLLFVKESGELSPTAHRSSTFIPSDQEWYIAEWGFKNHQRSGKTTGNLPSAKALYIPIESSRTIYGIVGLEFTNENTPNFEQQTFLNSVIDRISAAVEREYLNNLAKNSLVIAESENLYKTLFNSLSHELKTPITTILAASSTLRNKNSSENSSLILDEIEKAGSRLNRLVENLLDMTRLESGRLSTHKELNEISEVVASAIRYVKNLHVENEFVFKCDSSDTLFEFDYRLIEQSLINVIHNCSQYSPKEGRIYVTLSKTPTEFSIVIEDEGPGFAQESLAHIFDKFYRAPGAKAGGTGLGLSIAKGFIEAHNGMISAENRVPNGAKFRIIFPIIKDYKPVNDEQ